MVMKRAFRLAVVCRGIGTRRGERIDIFQCASMLSWQWLGGGRAVRPRADGDIAACRENNGARGIKKCVMPQRAEIRPAAAALYCGGHQ